MAGELRRAAWRLAAARSVTRGRDDDPGMAELMVAVALLIAEIAAYHEQRRHLAQAVAARRTARVLPRPRPGGADRGTGPSLTPLAPGGRGRAAAAAVAPVATRPPRPAEARVAYVIPGRASRGGGGADDRERGPDARPGHRAAADVDPGRDDDGVRGARAAPRSGSGGVVGRADRGTHPRTHRTRRRPRGARDVGRRVDRGRRPAPAGQGGERHTHSGGGWVTVWIGPLDGGRTALLASAGPPGSTTPTATAAVSCTDTATAVELADDLLAGGPDQLDRLDAFATLSARRAAAAAHDVAEPEPARLARTAAAG